MNPFSVFFPQRDLADPGRTEDMRRNRVGRVMGLVQHGFRDSIIMYKLQF